MNCGKNPECSLGNNNARWQTAPRYIVGSISLKASCRERDGKCAYWTIARLRVLCMTCGLLLPPCIAFGQDAALTAERRSVVQIRVHRDGLSDETAAAVLVGWTDQHAYFATAYHAVAPKGIVPVRSVEVRLYASPERLDAQVFDRLDADLDLAVVRTAIPATMPRVPLASAAPKPAASIRIIGHPASGEWSVWSGAIQNETAAGGDIQHFVYSDRDLPGDGFSGGGIFDAGGALLGIHSETAKGYGVGIKVSEMLRRFSVWAVPSNAIGSVAAGAPITEEKMGTDQLRASLDGFWSLPTGSIVLIRQSGDSVTATYAELSVDNRVTNKRRKVGDIYLKATYRQGVVDGKAYLWWPDSSIQGCNEILGDPEHLLGEGPIGGPLRLTLSQDGKRLQGEIWSMSENGCRVATGTRNIELTRMIPPPAQLNIEMVRNEAASRNPVFDRYLNPSGSWTTPTGISVEISCEGDACSGTVDVVPQQVAATVEGAVRVGQKILVGTYEGGIFSGQFMLRWSDFDEKTCGSKIPRNYPLSLLMSSDGKSLVGVFSSTILGPFCQPQNGPSGTLELDR
jgi:hypothetical protein